MKGRKNRLFSSNLAENDADKNIDSIKALLKKYRLWNGCNEGALLNNIHYSHLVLEALNQLTVFQMTQENVNRIITNPEEAKPAPSSRQTDYIPSESPEKTDLSLYDESSEETCSSSSSSDDESSKETCSSSSSDDESEEKNEHEPINLQWRRPC